MVNEIGIKMVWLSRYFKDFVELVMISYLSFFLSDPEINNRIE